MLSGVGEVGCSDVQVMYREVMLRVGEEVC